MAKIFISSLPFGADESFVRNLFEPFGQASKIELHADWVHPTYEPFAHVELAAEHVARAIDELDGKKFGQNHIRVHEHVELPASARRPYVLKPATI
jgi:RNA recognition motif-containing protein